MTALRLRFPNRQQPDLVLGPGVHGIGRDAGERPVVVDHPELAMVQFCVDRRGVWLKVQDGRRGLHVNGRPVRRMALLRAGDAIFVDGSEWLLLGDTPPSAPGANRAVAGEPPGDPRMVLRGVGGNHHGRSITLDRARVVGRLAECEIRIDDPAFADRHAILEPHPEGVVLRDLGSHEGSLVNGWPTRSALLRPGDQVVFDTQRFVVEAPSLGSGETHKAHKPMPQPVDDTVASANEARLSSSARRVPWLLLAALFLACALSLLLVYGAR